MFRGGGGGGAGSAFGAQVFEMLGGLLGLPSGDLLRILVGLALIILIIWLIRRTPAPSPRPVQPSPTCMLCGRRLTGRTYVDRYLPSWVACEACYEELAPRQQRQYRVLSTEY
jgi:hypothetical protein